MASRSTWARRIARWERSGLTRAEFAAREGVKPASLSWWRWELRRARASAAAALVKCPTFVEVEVVPSPRAAPTPERIGVALGNGRMVLVPQGFDDETLTRVLAIAERR